MTENTELMFTHSTILCCQGPRDKPPSKGVNHKNHTPNSSNSSRTTSGCVSTYSSALPPTSGYMLYRAKAIILPPPNTLSLFCKWPLPHHFTYTLQPLSSGDRPGSNCGFCVCAPSPHSLPVILKGAAPPCQLSSYNCLQTQGPNDRIYST